MQGLYATEYIFYAPLITASSQDYKSNPTIAAGDFKVSTDGSGWTNLDTLPSLSPAADIQVKFTVSIAEMTGKKVTIQAIDAAGAEWEDDFWEVDTYGHASAQHPNIGVDLATDISNIDAKTTNLPTDPADQSLLVAEHDATQVIVTAIQNKTDNLPTDPADQSLLYTEHIQTQTDIASLVNQHVETQVLISGLDVVLSTSHGAADWVSSGTADDVTLYETEPEW